ncbi:MAG: hypothetical protein A2315_09230 [Ignavibacteria bacterium RIFOXYB2_FULL_35_12]|nr:MAG: hypothetical protein A2058_07790 [Ignavibacteria bacterium GWA2_36_19]OGU53856.1 MAG: hypothetical protein A2006_14665 [Ignavibacteria bacterium GWC2_35_8]OGU58145.1 MAG: hypothetical protein A2X60_00280 [Ignavibacteria bacterium GWF2_35_20]OGU89684.1 MAG: hypothetical protein A2492_12670 [Ignavibacteria bacterium RIFOXYC12_FULL_35_11]OGU90069.1 MAG: hypothetical protein A3K31_05665 [Ignavibacteria bacterium RIFOXYA12_FULL_35_25]OGU95512.1 MAG: hypothetical protein A2347_00290 [Ignavib
MIGTKISRCAIICNLDNRSGSELTSRYSALQLILHRSFKNLLFTVLVFLIFSPCINSQQAELQFENILVEGGMPVNVQSIFQDRTGFLWFATWSGLYKYDGYNFIAYRHDVEDTASIRYNTLSVIYEDKAGILWIGSRLGLERFDPKSETFIHYTPNPIDTESNASNDVWSICEDKSGTLWVGSGNGLYKFDRVKEKFTCLRHDSTNPGSQANHSVNAIYEDREGSLWFGTEAGLDKLDFETGKFTHYASKYNVRYFCEDNAGILWLGTTEAILEFNLKDCTYSSYRINLDNPKDRINQICRDVVTGSLWIGTRFGLYNFNRESKKSIRYLSERIPAICNERSGALWIGTYTGIKRLNLTINPFKRYPMDDIAHVILNGSEGVLWIYNYGFNWKKFEIRKNQLVQYSFGKNSLFYIWNSGADMSLRTPDGGLLIQDTLGNIIFSLDSSWKDYIDNASFGWKTDKEYYVGGWTGYFGFWEPKTNRVVTIKKFQQAIYWIFEDSFGLIWIATEMGKLFLYNQTDNSFKEFITDTKNPLSLSGNRITQIYEDKKRRLWFATVNGLDRLERSTGNFIHLTIKHGLASDNIRGILEDEHGNLWLNTPKGISKFDPETNKFKNYDVSYGLDLPADVYYGIGCKTKNGEMYFPGAKGFTRFHPDSIKDNPFIPPIVITSFKKFDKPSPYSNEIHLPYYENFISFEFAALSYIIPERNQYAYMMEGLDRDWVYSGTRRYASYPNLDPGEYVFKVKGSNNDGIWNETGTSISIIISPPWWKTTWAYILYSVLILSIIYITWKMQVRRIRMSHEYEMSQFEAQKLHEVDEIKSRFFTNISHEFRTPLTLILGPIKQIIERTKEEKTKEDLKVVHKNANRLLGLVNQLLDISKLESGGMKLQTAPRNIVSLLKALTLSFTSYAERKRITLKFNSSEDEIIAYIDKDKIEKIITNVLSNAFKFTPEGGRIGISISQGVANSPLERGTKACPPLAGVCKNAEIKITDTGIGIPSEKLPKIFDRFYQVDGSHTREQEGTGIGLSLTKELVELHKGTIEVESEAGKGTTVTISIPLGKEHLKPEEICEKEADKDKDYDKEEDELVVDVEEEIQRKEHEKIGFKIFEKESLPILLIVEDNSDVRNYIKNNLNKDYRILEAVDGEDGWNKSIKQIPDLIVSDVMMPNMDGFKLCEKLKSDERTSHIPVILLTAKAALQDKVEGYEIGADDYIMKPFETSELSARILNLIKQRERLHEHFKKLGIIEFEEQKITSLDKKFLQKVFEIINQNISDPMLGVELLMERLAISRSVLYRKIISLTGEPPGELIRRLRLNKAAKLIEQKYGNLSEIALEVGFSNPARFSESFKKQFGISPSHYEQKNNKN